MIYRDQGAPRATGHPAMRRSAGFGARCEARCDAGQRGVRCSERGARSVVHGARSAGLGVRGAECGAECGVRSAGWSALRDAMRGRKPGTGRGARSAERGARGAGSGVRGAAGGAMGCGSARGPERCAPRDVPRCGVERRARRAGRKPSRSSPGALPVPRPCGTGLGRPQLRWPTRRGPWPARSRACRGRPRACTGSRRASWRDR